VGSKRPAGGFIRLKEQKTTAHISEMIQEISVYPLNV